MKKQHLLFYSCLVLALTLFSACSSDNDTPEENLLLEIGQEYQGGIIFYLDNTQEHGLIAYQSDLAGAPWGCFNQPTPVPPTAPIAQNNGIGFGLQNTLAIINFCEESNIAARQAYNLSANGYDDWYLPSIDELQLIYENRDLIGGFPDLENDFDLGELFVYASSSEGWKTSDGDDGFYYLNYQVYDFSNNTAFENTRNLFTGKANAAIVRPIRSF